MTTTYYYLHTFYATKQFYTPSVSTNNKNSNEKQQQVIHTKIITSVLCTDLITVECSWQIHTEMLQKINKDELNNFTNVLYYKKLTFCISFCTASQFLQVFLNTQFHPDHKWLYAHVYCRLSHELHPSVAKGAFLLHNLNTEASQFTTLNKSSMNRLLSVLSESTGAWGWLHKFCAMVKNKWNLPLVCIVSHITVHTITRKAPKTFQHHPLLFTNSAVLILNHTNSIMENDLNWYRIQQWEDISLNLSQWTGCHNLVWVVLSPPRHMWAY